MPMSGGTQMAGGRRANDRWDAPAAYERYMGRWSCEVSRRFVAWLGQGPGLRWLDVGCGTGAVTASILAATDSQPLEVWGVDPSAAFVAICKPRPLATLFSRAGLEAVETQAIDVITRFGDFDDFWGPFQAGHGMAPSHLVSLPDRDRVAVRERLRSRLPQHPDGSIELLARAWAVRGTVRG